MMNILLYQILVSTIHKNFKKSYYNNKFKASAPAWNNKAALPDGYLYLDEYSSKNMKYFQAWYTKYKTKLHLRLRQRIMLNF